MVRAIARFLSIQTPSAGPRSTSSATGITPDAGRSSTTLQRVTVALLAVFVAIQIGMPLRHHLDPGDVAWTEEGHRYSWRMKLRSKSGNVV